MASSKESTAKVWLITGASSGMGKELALKALAEGDHVIATSRSIERLSDLKAKGAVTVKLDQNQSIARGSQNCSQ
ncbi:MAG: hypothetical protein M1830_009928 [Pleopsidium flavum]|nr:MAG: hypothetical protein M1830_009928 [Pleopsidium flavum]